MASFYLWFIFLFGCAQMCNCNIDSCENLPESQDSCKYVNKESDLLSRKKIMPKYTLSYFDGRSRGELIRVILAYKGVEFEDKRITDEEWPELKKDAPFGQLPLLTLEDGTVIPQSVTIARYLAKEHGLAGENNLEAAKIDALVDGVSDMAFTEVFQMIFGSDAEQEAAKKVCEEKIPVFLGHFERHLKDNGSGFIFGKSITWADLALALGVDELQRTVLGESIIEPFPLVKEHKTKIFNLPPIKAYMEKRKPTPW